MTLAEQAALSGTGASDRLETDVLIIGAGPTGLTLANLLGGMGVRTVIVERNATTVEEPRAVSIDDESMRTMQAIGLAEAVQAIVSRGYGSRYLAPDGSQFALVEPDTLDYGFDKRNAFQQPELEALLRQGLARFPVVTALFSHDQIGFQQDAETVTATIRRPDGSIFPVRASYMVACDGGRSAIRKALGIELVGSTFTERWLIVDLFKTQNRFRHTEVRCDPRRPSISLPGPAGIRRYEFMLRADETEGQATDEGFVRGLLGDVGPDRDAPLRRMRVYAFHARLAETWRRGRIFLAGDAAHLSPPFAGQGMNSGLRDAHNLGWKLAEAVRGTADDAFLDSYEIERRPHAWEMISLALRMGSIMMPASRLRGVLTRAAFHIMGLYPPIRDYFAQMRYKPKPRFKAGLLWPDLGGAMVGGLLPQPIVEDLDRKRVLLDTILPDRPVVIVFSEFPEREVSLEARLKLEAAGAFVIGLTPEWMNIGAADFPIVRDVSRFFSRPAFRRHLGHAFLLRRDRYVAATVPAGAVEQLLPMIGRLTLTASASDGCPR